MISEKTQKTIENKVIEIWKRAFFYDDDMTISKVNKPDFELNFAKDGSYLDIEITAMYDAPGCSFEQLRQLAEFFNTTRIDRVSEIESGGCETCDYGSCYGFTLRVEKPKSEADLYNKTSLEALKNLYWWSE